MSFHTIHEGRQTQRRARLGAALALLLTGVGLSRLASGGQSGATPPSGQELFTTYCASCHGVDASGNGPLARTLRHQPADLTTLSARNGGMFPEARARRIVEGRDVESHGDREMPVWGDAFRSTREGRSPELATARINAVVRYLETVQRRSAQ